MEPVRGGSLSALGDGNTDPVSLAFRFVKSFENIKVVLSGMSALEHVEENVKTFSEDRPLSKAELGLIDEMRANYLNSRAVACTGCGYCQPCPGGIEIPKLFALYNGLMLQGQKEEFLSRYPGFEKTAKDCLECNKCMKVCPQSLEIPKKLKEVASTYKFLHS
jgi:Predicted oxidoreductases of the aldo/keto reductase family